MNYTSYITTLFFSRKFFLLATVIVFLSSCSTPPPPSSPTTENTPPTAQITRPSADSGTNDTEFIYDGYDDSKGMWYTDVTLEGVGVDAEDGALSPDSLVWTTNQTSLQTAQLGTGNSLTVRLYSNECFGTNHVVSLTVTDNDGSSLAVKRNISIWTLC